MKNFFISVFLVIASTVYFLVPIFKPFPPLTGDYRVGLITTQWYNKSRQEKYKKESALNRSIVAHIWYPASGDTVQKVAPYLGNKMPHLKKAFAHVYGIPLWVSNVLLRNIKSRSFADAPLDSTKSQWPVLIFTHGLLGAPSDMYSALLEDLASHGYIVIGLDLPYFNFLTLHEDGRVSSSAAMSDTFNKMSQDEQKQFMSAAIELYKQDIGFAIDQLHRINNNHNNMFYNRLDLKRIGVIGHSAGGTAAIEFCRIDKRCTAAVNLDGWYDHIISPNPLPVPLLMVFGQKSIEITKPTAEYLKCKELTKEHYYLREKAIAEHKEQLCKNNNCKMIIIPNAEHTAFSDELLLKWPLRSWQLGDAYTIINETNKQVINFFNAHL